MRTKEKVQKYIDSLSNNYVDRIIFEDENGKNVFSTKAEDIIDELIDTAIAFYERELEHAVDDSGANVRYDGKLCKCSCFTTYQYYKCDETEMKQILSLPIQKVEDIKDINDPSKHRWYMVSGNSGDGKYGRLMYDPMTKTLRGLTMGEFYQNSTVD